MDIGLGLTGWKTYSVSGIETFASPYIRSKPSHFHVHPRQRLPAPGCPPRRAADAPVMPGAG